MTDTAAVDPESAPLETRCLNSRKRGAGGKRPVFGLERRVVKLKCTVKDSAESARAYRFRQRHVLHVDRRAALDAELHGICSGFRYFKCKAALCALGRGVLLAEVDPLGVILRPRKRRNLKIRLGIRSALAHNVGRQGIFSRAQIHALLNRGRGSAVGCQPDGIITVKWIFVISVRSPHTDRSGCRPTVGHTGCQCFEIAVDQIIDRKIGDGRRLLYAVFCLFVILLI
ncbi:unknown [Anaerotruncus sp. CAG:390]|nr:unknown [Anaerotruncus sp. CAG:390]